MVDAKLTSLPLVTETISDDRFYIVRDPTGIPLDRQTTMSAIWNYSTGGIVNVKQFGGKGDGVTDDTAAIQAAWNTVSDGEILDIPKGTYLISDTIRFTNKDYVCVRGNDSLLRTKTGANFTGKAMVDFSGYGHGRVDDLRVTSDLLVNIPAAAVVLGRWDAGDGCHNLFNNCKFSGNFSKSTLYDIGSECSTYIHCFLQSTSIQPVYFTSNVDIAHLTHFGDASNTRKSFYSCYFANNSSLAGQKLIVIDTTTKGISIRDSFMGISEACHCISLEGGGGSSTFGLILDNIDVEGTNKAGSRFLYLGASNSLNDSFISQISWLEISDYVIELATATIGTSWINALHTHWATKFMKVSANCTTNVILGKGDAQISVDGGISFFANHLIWMSAASPLTGAGSYGAWGHDDNIVNRLYGYNTEISGEKYRRYGAYCDNATPNVSGASIFELIYFAPTTITNFLSGVPGQEITLIATTALATIQHNANIILANHVDFPMLLGSTLTLIYYEHAGKWYEKSRMVA